MTAPTIRRVLRVVRRLSAWEKEDPREIAAVEFQDRRTGGLDRRPSVYVLEAPDDRSMRRATVQVRAEHTIAFLRPQGGTDLDLQGVGGEPERSPGTTGFPFADQAHAELLMPDEPSLLALVQVVRQELERRTVETPQREILDYIVGRVEAEDGLWLARVNANESWAKAVARHRRRPPP